MDRCYSSNRAAQGDVTDMANKDEPLPTAVLHAGTMVRFNGYAVRLLATVTVEGTPASISFIESLALSERERARLKQEAWDGR